MRFAQDYNKRVNEIVQDNYRAAGVFKKFGINYRENHLSLEEACRSKNVSCQQFMEELNRVSHAIHLFSSLPFENWKIEFLIDYIINVHHTYLQLTLPELEEGLLFLAAKPDHGCQSLPRIILLFKKLSFLLLQHSSYEEQTIFPYIKQINHAYRYKETYGSLFVRTLGKPLDMLDKEHTVIENLFDQLEELTDHYRPINKTCAVTHVVFKKLEELNQDILQHIYLEEKVLFPRAIQIEKEVLSLQ